MSNYNAINICQSELSINANNFRSAGGACASAKTDEQKVNDKEHRAEWNNPVEFLMTCIGKFLNFYCSLIDSLAFHS